MIRVGKVGAWLAATGLVATAWGLSVSVVASGPHANHARLDTSGARGSEQTVVRAPWGSGPGEAGRTSEGELRGPMSFAVDDRERIWLLDQENGRLLLFAGPSGPVAVKLPAGSYEDIVAERDRICVLSQAPGRRVLVFDDGGRLTTAFDVPASLPPVLRVLIDATDILVECPGEAGRTYHVVGSLTAPGTAAQRTARVARESVPLARGLGANARVTSSHDVAIDIARNSGAATARIRLHAEEEVNAILDVSGDSRGCVYLTTVTAPDGMAGASGTTLTMSRFAPDGELSASASTAYDPLTDVVRRVVVAPTGAVYRMDSDSAGVRIVRWDLNEAGRGADR